MCIISVKYVVRLIFYRRLIRVHIHSYNLWFIIWTYRCYTKMYMFCLTYFAHHTIEQRMIYLAQINVRYTFIGRHLKRPSRAIIIQWSSGIDRKRRNYFRTWFNNNVSLNKHEFTYNVLCFYCYFSQEFLVELNTENWPIFQIFKSKCTI